MPVYVLQREQRVAMSLDDCWRFFSDPRNLEKITPPSLRFRVRSELPAEVYAGMMIRYTVSPLFGIPMTWVTEITHMRKPHYFADEQRVGPYRLWHHEHSFRAINDRESEVLDLIHYAPPLGALGAILNKLLVRPQLERIFNFRTEQLEKTARDSGA
jgi:ligand-binding SRPBCC domain-containing protein